MFQELWQSITDVGTYSDPLRAYFEQLSVSSVVMTILAIFSVVGLVEKPDHNMRRYGHKFDRGFHA